MEDKKKKVTTPKTPEPPQRIYPVSEPGEAKGGKKKDPELEKEKKQKKEKE